MEKILKCTKGWVKIKRLTKIDSSRKTIELSTLVEKGIITVQLDYPTERETTEGFCRLAMIQPDELKASILSTIKQ